jgi:muramoyltetrapeptide carboxypeptidase
MRKPRALQPGDRIAVVAPASPFAREAFDAGVAEIRALGFDPVFDESVFERRGYVAGTAATRAAAFLRAWNDPAIAALVAARGGYGSAQLLPLLQETPPGRTPKAFIGYSDNTSLLSWLTLARGIVSFHGPMLEGRLARGEAGYDRDSFTRCLCRPEPAGELVHPQLETLSAGEAAGLLAGGTLTQLAALMGTPFAFDPPRGSILFLEDVGERPYRLDRLLTQLRLGGILERAAGIVFGEMRTCDEPGGAIRARDTIADVLAGFRGPVLLGFPSGHTTGPTFTLPFGVRARIVAGPGPMLVIEERAVEA